MIIDVQGLIKGGCPQKRFPIISMATINQIKSIKSMKYQKRENL